MNQWLRFFFGTPRSFLATFAVVGLIIVLIFPGLLRMAAERLVGELTPLLGPALAVVIVFAGIRMILRAGRG